MSQAPQDTKAPRKRAGELLTLAVGLGGLVLFVYGVLRAREQLGDYALFWVLALTACPSDPPPRVGRLLSSANWLVLGSGVLVLLIGVITLASSGAGWSLPVLGLAICCSSLGRLIEMYQAPQDGPLPWNLALSALSVVGLAVWLWLETHPGVAPDAVGLGPGASPSPSGMPAATL